MNKTTVNDISSVKFTDACFNSEEQERYSRHFLLEEVGFAGQKKIKSGAILVVGAGGLGCPALLYLAAAGVGRIGIVDFDTVSLTNLQRQVLFHTAHIDLFKVNAAADALRALNPNTMFEQHQIKLTEANVREIISGYDVVIDATDNFSTRYLINDTCVDLKVPLVFGAAHGVTGQCVFFTQEACAPCLRCLFPLPPAEGTTQNCAQAGVLGVVPGVIGTLQASWAIRFLVQGAPAFLASEGAELLQWNLWEGAPRSYKVRKNPACRCAHAGAPDQNATWVASEVTPAPKPSTKPEQLQSDPEPLRPDVVTASEYKALLEEAVPHVLLDVRTIDEAQRNQFYLPSEYSYLATRLHIPLSELLHRKSASVADLLLRELHSLKSVGQQTQKTGATPAEPALPVGTLIIVFCASGKRSLTATQLLRDQGLQKVFSLACPW